MDVSVITAYILVWPVLASLILLLLLVTVTRDFRAAKKAGKDMV